jgi:hypothetical protein
MKVRRKPDLKGKGSISMSKPIRACMALVAFAAFAVGPATASAENKPQLLESGTALATGAKIVGTNVGSTFFTDTSGNTLVDCSTTKLAGTVTKNTIGAVEGEITTFDFSSTGAVSAHNGLNECTGSFGNAYYTLSTLPLCLRSTSTMATSEFQVSSGKCAGGGKVKFIMGSTTIGECEFESGGVLKGDYKTNTSEITIRSTAAGSGSKLIRGGFFCPASTMLKMTFKLETENGTAITIS